MNEIIVTNNNDFYHEDMFDGRKFGFPSKEKVLVPEAAATHMLGFNRADKTETLTRLGWANMDTDEGVKRLAKFVFTRPMVIEAPADGVTDATNAMAVALARSDESVEGEAA